MHPHPRRRSASINLHHGGDPAGLTPSLTITGIEPALTIIVRFIFFNCATLAKQPFWLFFFASDPPLLFPPFRKNLKK